MTRVTEEDVAMCVARIAANQANGICSLNRARKEIPNMINLSAADLAPSVARTGEPMWHQLIRNIKSHDKAYGNFIERGFLAHVSRRGYEITPSGRKLLKKKGF